jgi:hypothetical protein
LLGTSILTHFVLVFTNEYEGGVFYVSTAAEQRGSPVFFQLCRGCGTFGLQGAGIFLLEIYSFRSEFIKKGIANIRTDMIYLIENMN